MLSLYELSNLGPPLFILTIITLASFFFYFGFHHQKDLTGKKIPPGSLGLPFFGETFSFVKAQREDKGDEWIRKRAAKYGPVFKTSIMGCPTVVITGRTGNKFVFTANDEAVSMKQPPTIVRLTGRHNLFELTGTRYRLVKGALMNFLKPESLQDYIGHMGALVKHQLLTKTEGKDTILAVPLMKKLTFNITCSLLFGLHHEPTNEALFEDFVQVLAGLFTIPINLPGTAYWRALRARSRIDRRALPILQSRKELLTEGILKAKDDIISSILSLKDENNEPLTEEAVTDNFVALIIASHDTTAILLSLMVWKLARDPEIYSKVSEEQMAILRDRQDDVQGKLTWNEVQRMKYTWRVAQELMRIIPPVSGSLRKAVKDLHFGGYDIPQGWQLLWETSGTHMDKDIFEDPTNFDPSRFESPSKPVPPFAYIPFGAGYRMCIGNEFARVEVLTVMHHLVTKFEWSQLFPDETITRRPLPYPSKGLPIKLKRRKLSDFERLV
ncbi:taxane 13-alpha-hydroxylase [Elaeis guineensis]|uniref:Taxane 13-alpha-hydroxylase n=1 Tax=Elaeis guineensis var. tenera TaxID=51953 RepID=A0A6I9RAT7_ELAGV|nr:taxane 13-alpha-hydroxylase [Elaeis guineensis]